MQILKTDIRNRILVVSRKIFLKEGFSRTKIREIATRSEISVGNLYNYFSNKEEILKTIVCPTLDKIDNAFKCSSGISFINDEYKWGFEYHIKFIDKVALFIEENRENLNLILFRSSGSYLENYKDNFIDRYTKLMQLNMQELESKNPGAVKNVSEFFLHTICSLNANVLTELLMHNVTFREIKENLNELMVFLFHGWKPFIDKSCIFETT